MYEDFLILMQTIERENNPFQVLLIGKKDNANNEIMVNLGVERSQDIFKDSIMKIDNVENGYFIDVGFDTFKHLKIRKSLTRNLATLNEATNRYFNKAGYIIDFFDEVINFEKRIKSSGNKWRVMGHCDRLDHLWLV